ncbi:hypothetical protein ACFFIS_13005 [Virgibacillus soli]|uniref:GNAT family N-acetyltransferase n=1 Tax=Paracerasibacillus soli TaxID=480284 RepID=A0ABU5CT26_9BACI|nr:hypothetical protein [Virgibacillus soli]MDY0409502.1 hypothetical protein [Virgibacillus soli]
MKLIAAKHIATEEMEQFIQTAQHVEQKHLLKEGYVVKMNDEIKGCFVLSSIEKDKYWLKQMYIAQDVAASLPVLLETIIVLVKELEAEKLIVHSHQPVLDMILDALQFHQQEHAQIVDKPMRKQGNWWAYEVS